MSCAASDFDYQGERLNENVAIDLGFVFLTGCKSKPVLLYENQ